MRPGSFTAHGLGPLGLRKLRLEALKSLGSFRSSSLGPRGLCSILRLRGLRCFRAGPKVGSVPGHHRLFACPWNRRDRKTRVKTWQDAKLCNRIRRKPYSHGCLTVQRDKGPGKPRHVLGLYSRAQAPKLQSSHHAEDFGVRPALMTIE